MYLAFHFYLALVRAKDISSSLNCVLIKLDTPLLEVQKATLLLGALSYSRVFWQRIRYSGSSKIIFVILTGFKM